MKRPSFQFYPADWMANPNLKRCTFEERGVWVEVMCLMHDQDEYGVIRWPLDEIATAIRCDLATLKALVRKDVLKGDDEELTTPFIYTPRSGRKDGEPVNLVEPQAGPIWYSSRMVRDEHVRIKRSVTDEGNSPKAAPKTAPKPPFGEGFGEPMCGGFDVHLSPAQASRAPPSSSSSTPLLTSFVKDAPFGTSANLDEAEVQDQPLPTSVSKPGTHAFSAGLNGLKAQGLSEAGARAFLGKLGKVHGNQALDDAVDEVLARGALVDMRSALKAALIDDGNAALRESIRDGFNAVAGRIGITEMSSWTPGRKSALRTLQKADGCAKLRSAEAWREVFCEIESSDFLSGRANKSDGTPFVLSLDTILSPDFIAKLREDRYANRKAA